MVRSRFLIRWVSVIFLVLSLASCRKENEIVSIILEPEHIVAGLDGIVLRVSGQDLPTGASIRVNGETIQTRKEGDVLYCSLSRTLTLPADTQASEWCLPVELVDSTGAAVSETVHLTVLRDYQWNAEQKIDDQEITTVTDVHAFSDGTLSVLYCSEGDLYRVSSGDSGATWQAAEALYTLKEGDGAVQTVISGDHIVVLVETNGTLACHDLTDGKTFTLPDVDSPNAFSVCSDSACLHLAWETELTEYRHIIRYIRSDDFGSSWSEARQVLDYDGGNYIGLSGLVACAGGHVFVSYQWSSDRYTIDAGRHSHDGGLTWTDGSAMNRSNTLFRGNGVVLKFGRDMYIPYMYRACINCSTDWGDTWENVYTPENNEFASAYHLAADLFGNLLVSLTPSDGGNKRFARSFDGGVHWIVPDEGNTDLPACSAIYIDENGNAMVFVADESGLVIRRGLSSF